MKQTFFTMALAVVLLLGTTRSFAWGQKGHALVAEVAFHYMDETTKKNVMQFLGGMSIEEAANWMDAIKSDHANDYMKPYHYIDFEKGSKEIPEGDNIVTVLNSTLKDLDHKETLSQDEIKRRILILFHLIGDLHQPLHIGYPSDKGGNNVQLNFMGAYGTNLHATWDSGIIEYKGTTLQDVLNSKKYTSEEFAAVQKTDIIGWAKQSRGFLKEAYSVRNNKADDFYVDAVYPIIENQILDAGIRLAGLLEHYFKTTS
ncbi:S1/P1 nuclease [Flavobacterium sp. N1994]|uniref:S1/P1 nuclease n=1 Tax=Flavobacterium sp. N1994 TaxID=2986827 RepID=UPI00222165FF|nr:S1/P1 nuclease [Flavobacterium sp. N1994]